MNLDELNEYSFNIFLVIGVIGFGALILIPGLALVLPFWSFQHDSFIILLSISMWMSTFTLPALSKIGIINIMTRLTGWSTSSKRTQINYLRSRDRFRYNIEKSKQSFVWGIFYAITIVLPIGATLYIVIHPDDKGFIALIPLFINLILTLIFIVNSQDFLLGLIPACISIICILFLWFHPEFHPLKIFTVYITTGEVVISGIVSGSNT